MFRSRRGVGGGEFVEIARDVWVFATHSAFAWVREHARFKGGHATPLSYPYDTWESRAPAPTRISKSSTSRLAAAR